MFSCGKVPYPTIKAMELLSEIRNGYTLDPPENGACPDAMYVANCDGMEQLTSTTWSL